MDDGIGRFVEDNIDVFLGLILNVNDCVLLSVNTNSSVDNAFVGFVFDTDISSLEFSCFDNDWSVEKVFREGFVGMCWFRPGSFP